MASHLKEYLDYYKTRESPGYAVLVTGEWGTGKTFQVKQALAEEEQYYVSLFGLQTAEDVHSAVIAVTDPTLAKVRAVVDRVGDTAKDMGGPFALGGLIPGVMNRLVRHVVETDRTLIFDDLERCGLELQDRLGVINTYVEHHGFRVVVIAHDEELVDKFKDTKEKLFGQTIKVEPHVDEAFDDFCSQLLTPEKQEYLNNHRAEIMGIFEASKVKSLRILRHVIEDLGRLHEMLDDDHLRNTAAMAELVGLFSALNMEVRSSRPLLEEDLNDRQKLQHRHELLRISADDGKPEKHKLLVADEKYATVDLTSNLLQDTPIIQMLIEGRYDQGLVRASLNNSVYFLKPEDVPPWKVVINFDELEDDVVASALVQMQKQFDNHEVTDSGEMLHIFSLRIMMADKGAIDDNIPTIVEDCKAYIDYLLAANQLPPRETDWRWKEHFDSGGYGYWVSDANRDQFNEILHHLVKAREQALENLFPEITAQLINFMKTDGRAFLEQVCFTNKGENIYALIPVLSHISPEAFVGVWMEAPKENWKQIYYALKGRYEGNRLNDELKSEKEWIQQVIKLLDEEVEKADGLQALRIERAIPDVLRASD